jgi:hypothetical protein
MNTPLPTVSGVQDDRADAAFARSRTVRERLTERT